MTRSGVSVYKDTNLIGLEPAFMTLLNLEHLLKGPVSKNSHIEG